MTDNLIAWQNKSQYHLKQNFTNIFDKNPKSKYFKLGAIQLGNSVQSRYSIKN
jgi:hypothetical protein